MIVEALGELHTFVKMRNVLDWGFVLNDYCGDDRDHDLRTYLDACDGKSRPRPCYAISYYDPHCGLDDES